MKSLPLTEKKNHFFLFIAFQKNQGALSFPFIMLFVFKANLKSNFHDKNIIFPAPHALNIVFSSKIEFCLPRCYYFNL